MQVFTCIIEFRGKVSHYSEQTVTTCTPERPITKKIKDYWQSKAWVIRGSYSLELFKFYDLSSLFPWPSPVFLRHSFSCHFQKVSKLHVSFSKGIFWSNSVQQAQTLDSVQHKNCVAFASFNDCCLCLIFLCFDINSY